MGLTNYFYFRNASYLAPGTTAVPSSIKPIDPAETYDTAYWTPSRWSFYSFSMPSDEDVFPSSIEITILNELFDKLMLQLSKDDRRFHRRDSAMRGRPSRSSSCSSSSSVSTALGAARESTVELHTTCLLLGEHISKMANNASYWGWSVPVFAKLAEIYNKERTNNDNSTRLFVLATVCLLTCQMCKTLSSVLTVTTECFDLPPLSKAEKQKVNAFLSDKALGYILYLVETEGNDAHHIAGETVSFILAQITLSPHILRVFFEASKRDKLFNYPRFRHLRIWRYMWLKVIFERLVFLGEQLAPANASGALSSSSVSIRSIPLGSGSSVPPSASQLAEMQKLTTDELFASFANEQDTYVKDHSELLFDCSLAPADRLSFVFNSTEHQAGAFLLGLNECVASLITSQRSALSV